ncbi:hypothetical protein [Nocardioides sp.]|uniref:hypothetical protein n=1 Tax=Nocardioides sp. TaxID=35761 RepID=UPI0025EAFAE8|nr:hypothetical protein [Nocardioides sp.]
MTSRARRPALRVARTVALTALLVTVPFATALVAIGYAPPAHVQVAGQQVSVRPVLGQDTSRLFQGALVRTQHQRLAGKAVGVDIDADWNRLVPSDKPTRRYLAGLWENPRPAIHLIGATARRHLLLWGIGGFVAGALAVGAVVGLSWQRRRRLASYSPEQAELVARHNRRLRLTLHPRRQPGLRRYAARGDAGDRTAGRRAAVPVGAAPALAVLRGRVREPQGRAGRPARPGRR